MPKLKIILDKLVFLYCLEFLPERVNTSCEHGPISSDLDNKNTGLTPDNFNPSENWNHLILVARKLKIKKLSTDQDYAYRLVLRKARETSKNFDVSAFLESHYQC